MQPFFQCKHFVLRTLTNTALSNAAFVSLRFASILNTLVAIAHNHHNFSLLSAFAVDRWNCLEFNVHFYHRFYRTSRVVFRIRSIIYSFIWYLTSIIHCNDAWSVHSQNLSPIQSIHYTLTLTQMQLKRFIFVYRFISILTITDESFHSHTVDINFILCSFPFCDLHRSSFIVIILSKYSQSFPGVRWHIWYYYYLILAAKMSFIHWWNAKWRRIQHTPALPKMTLNECTQINSKILGLFFWIHSTVSGRSLKNGHYY